MQPALENFGMLFLLQGMHVLHKISWIFKQNQIIKDDVCDTMGLVQSKTRPTACHPVVRHTETKGHHATESLGVAFVYMIPCLRSPMNLCLISAVTQRR